MEKISNEISGNMGKGVVFYRSFYEASKKIPKSRRLQFFDALFEYAFGQNVIDMGKSVAGLFELCKPAIDGAEYGKVGER